MRLFVLLLVVLVQALQAVGDRLGIVTPGGVERLRLVGLIAELWPTGARVAAIQTGEADILGRFSAEEAQSLFGAPGVQVLRYPVARVYYIAFNNMTTGLEQPTMDPKVRIAMNLMEHHGFSQKRAARADITLVVFDDPSREIKETDDLVELFFQAAVEVDDSHL